MKKLLSIVLSVALTSFTANAGSFLLNDYNLVTIGDFEATSAHVHGSAFIGGDLLGQTAEFGADLDRTSEDRSIVALTVAGSVDAQNVKVFQNDVVVSTENVITTLDNGNKFAVNGNEIGNQPTNVSYPEPEDTNLDSIRNDYAQQLISASAAFSQLETNSTIVTPSSDVNKRGFKISKNLAKDDYAVFSINGDDSIFDGTENLALKMWKYNEDDLSDLAGIIINVSGTGGDGLVFSDSSSMGNRFNNSNYRRNIIWNFYEATTININAQNFMGTLLAPLATVTTANDIEGSVGVNKLVLGGQIHLPNTIVKTPNPVTTTVEVPEPAPLFLMVIAIVGLLVKRKAIKV